MPESEHAGAGEGVEGMDGGPRERPDDGRTPRRDARRLARFFQRLARGQRSLLLLDYDGTLAPFREARNEAVPYPGVRDRLRAILDAGHTRVVVISGRSTDDLLPLLDLEEPPEIWGSHGWERRRPDGTVEMADLPDGAREALERAAGALDEAVFRGRVERKPASVAIHWRGAEAERKREMEEMVRRRWEPLVGASPLVLHPFDGGLELRLPGRDKGDAVEAILAEDDSAAPTAYLGDDRTDEDAFEALAGRGLRVLVRPEPRPSRADLWIRPPGELLEFLDRWHRAAGQSDGEER